VASQVQLAEASIDKQTRKLTEAVDTLMTSATTTEASVRGVSNELSGLTNHFNDEIKEFATNVVSEIKTVSGVANVTLENTKNAANAFSESVKTMATGVRETLIEMNTAHTQLSGQSQNLIKLSADTTAQLQPLSELIEKYYSALPDLSRTSIETNDNLNKIVSNLDKNIALMKQTVSDSTDAISESAVKLEDLAGQSRQQMIDLMSDYAKAVNSMQTLNKQMMVARASAPMDAIKNAPQMAVAAAAGSDFLKTVDFSKLHELSMDLTKAVGAEIPDVVWQKYHDGDATIFSKWLSKMLDASDKKQVRELLKSDSIFRSQASQFVRGFDKIIEAGLHTDTPDAVKSKLLKTDLGNIYTHLKGK
jgi:ABC-type transporter Mla subunit MlaD